MTSPLLFLPSLSPTMSSTAELYVPDHIVHNTKTITFIRSSMSVIAGSAAGILGLTGYTGFIFYGVVSLFTSFVIWAMKTKCQPGKYFKGKTDVWIDGVFGSLFSYVL